MTYPMNNACASCHKKTLQKVWVGTQQIESSLEQYYPKAKICRFDTDSIKNKTEKLSAISMLTSADIIIGTKMITTGFNIPNLGLIWVILLEQELQIPSYNTHEQVYSNITQLLWRGWRVQQKTEIIIQTFVPKNQMIESITGSNYKDFFSATLTERKLFQYPPFCEMVTLVYRHSDKQKSHVFLSKIHTKISGQAEQKKIYISQIWNGIKKQNQYFYSCIIKGHKLHDFLQIIKPEIYRNSWLQVIWGS
jgi:primosomal protein N' (replication factor Y) (superfamily II helicase)